MKQVTLCAQEFNHPIRSPFDQIICLGFYDGPTSGLARCQRAPIAYSFDLAAWDADQENRIYSLAEIGTTLFDSAVEILCRIEQPKWPFWLPNWELALGGEREKVSSQIEKILQKIPAPKYVAATDSIDQNIHALRVIDPSVQEHLPNRRHLPPLEAWSFWHRYFR
jgi:hypothetical protein